MEPGSFEAFLAADAGWLRARIKRRLPERAVDDVWQDILVSLWTGFDRYREEGRRRAFLARLADRRIADWWRKWAVMKESPCEVTPMPDPDPDRIARELEACGVTKGSLLWQRIVDDESLGTLALAHGLALGTVKSRIHYEGRELQRRLQDWRRAVKGQDVVCEHLRRGHLGVAVCPQCRDEQAAWRTIRTRSQPFRVFQATCVTVESSLSLWMDCTVSVAGWHPGDWGCTRADFGPLRRFVDGAGRDLSSRIRRRTMAGRPYFTYEMRPGDPHALHISQHIASETASAAGLKRRRSGIDLVVDVHYGEESDGALAVELPLGMSVDAAHPLPNRMASIHGHTLLEWASGAALAHAPHISGRWS